MIYYIDLSKELKIDLAFAWLNVGEMRFEEYNGIHVWESYKEFESDLLYYLRLAHTPEKIADEILGSFKTLYPREKQTSPPESEPS